MMLINFKGFEPIFRNQTFIQLSTNTFNIMESKNLQVIANSKILSLKNEPKEKLFQIGKYTQKEQGKNIFNYSCLFK